MTEKISDGVKFLMNRDRISLKELQKRKMVRLSKGMWVLNGKGNRKKQNESSHPNRRY